MNDSKYDLFGNEVEPKLTLMDRFIEPPFSTLDSRSDRWQKRKRKWKRLGIQSELGRGEDLTYHGMEKLDTKGLTGTSIFDPYLCEILISWFSEPQHTILDPFAGGSVRGVVASMLSRSYIGLELRAEQVESNREQALKICQTENMPVWVIGDSNQTLDQYPDESFDYVFSCPPYADLEVYSDDPADISNMSYEDFLSVYGSIINKAVRKLKKGKYACFVVSEVRDKKGYYRGFVADTITCFENAGARFYNDAVLINPCGTGPQRAATTFRTGKLVRLHQNILVFRKE